MHVDVTKITSWKTLTRFFFSYKNELYKNVEAENCRKFKNVLRMFRGSNSNQHRNFLLNLYKGGDFSCLR